MSNMNLDSIDRKLLNLVQVEFPLTKEPYADLGARLGIGGDEVIHRIEQLKAKGIVRQISPVLDARSLGYQITLVAMRVAEDQLDKAERLITKHTGISHGYERDHYFNLWFTLAIPPTADIETELQQLTSPIDVEAIFALPAIKLFKIGAYFDMGEDSQSAAETVTQPDGILPQKVELSQIDRLIINELQQDLPLIPRPFADMLARLGMDVEDFLAQCQSLRQRAVMRRFGAAVNHKRAGFKANGMACWVAPPNMVEVVGQKLASLREVSHCYERKTNLLWRYNLFAIIHGHTREACQEIASKVSGETGLKDYVLLFSTKEFKKVRVKYLV
ncbi:MAG: Lrp/AsnC family transcriptional regulator [Dehalococcoidia bacterium]|nr:MAG: Lrp/AsnC family transcriptional regulator [Dehalococcoidia bacterium]